MPEEPFAVDASVPPAPQGRAGKRIRIGLLIGLTLALFYICITFRLMVIPDDYVVLHPHVLPGQHWVYRVVRGGVAGIKPGSRLIFAFDAPGGKVVHHISVVVGQPGQTVVFEPAARQFVVNGTPLALAVDLSAAWTEGGRETVTVPAG